MRPSSAHGAGLLILALATACSPTPNILPTNDLNRPTDIAFMCLGAFTPNMTTTLPADWPANSLLVSGRPMRACHPRGDGNAKATQPGATVETRTFAFVPNSASGDLSVIDADNWKIVDLDKSTGGFGRVPLGALPEQISTSSDGCRLVSANRGSCDLTVVDPSTLLSGMFASQYKDDNVTILSGDGVQHVIPRREDGTLLSAAPYEAVFLPQDTSSLELSDNLCPFNGAAPTTTPWRALVTFPSCDLIALIDLPSGNIVASATAERVPGSDPSLDSVRFVDSGKSPTCPADCGTDRGSAVAPLGTAHPTSIVITPKGDHAYVSLSDVPAVFSLNLTPSTIAAAPKESIPLHDNAVGSNRLRLGVDPYSYVGPAHDFAGTFVGSPDRSYLYVIARDSSLRILDVASPGQEVECETNFDPLNNPNPTVSLEPTERCIEYGKVNRRQYWTNTAGLPYSTAGLRFPTMPIDVAAADMTLTSDAREETVNGGYAWVLTANGTVYLVNITPKPRIIKAVVHDKTKVELHKDEPTTLFETLPPDVAAAPFVYKGDPTTENGGVFEPPPFPNRPRDRNMMSYTVSQDPSLGLPRLDVPPLGLAAGPYIEPFWTQGTEDNSTALDPGTRQTFVFFPDRDGVVAQGWDATWQGPLVNPRYSGLMKRDVLSDGGGGFCSAGVQLGDIVTLNGCGQNSQCPTGMICHRNPAVDQVAGGFTVTGLCVNAHLEAALARDCGPYVGSVRRYDVVEAKQSSLVLAPHLDEVVRSSLSACLLPGEVAPGTSGAGSTDAGTNADGGASGDAGTDGDAGVNSTTVSGCDLEDGTTDKFECIEFASGTAASALAQRRCLNRCITDQNCRPGRVCLTGCTNGDIQCPVGTTCEADGLCRTSEACNANHACPLGQTCMNDKCEFSFGFCADGPPLRHDGCFPQLTTYQVNVNAGFLVTGTSAGSFAAGTEDATGHCREFTSAERDPRLVSRIPLRPAPGATTPIECDALTTPPGQTFPTLTTAPGFEASDGYFIDHFDARIDPGQIDGVEPVVHFTRATDNTPLTARPEAPQLVEWMKKWTQDMAAPNACIYLGGPITGDPGSMPDPQTRKDRAQHVRARFRNTQVAFVVANLDRQPSGAAALHFDVHGGFRAQNVIPLSTVEVSSPARLVLGPINSNLSDMITTDLAPYLFVVDQRRLGRAQGGGPTRGQIVRINPYGFSSQNGYVPIYEDYQRSGGKFPIQ